MATIAENINTLKTIKEDIKQAINNKGVTVADSDSFTLYANKISEIQAGGGNEEEIAKTARVLDITENGSYLSQYSDTIIITPAITGKYPNGDNFYDYAYISQRGYNTGIFPGPTTRLEFWWKFNGTIEQSEGLIVGAHKWGKVGSIFKVAYGFYTDKMVASINDKTINFPLPDAEWHHYTMSFKDGFFIDGEKIGDFEGNLVETSTYEPICINGYYGNSRINADDFGMVIIDDTIFIPTANGWLNTNTNEYLPIVQDKSGSYLYTQDEPVYIEGTGNLIKTVNVNVPPKIDANLLQTKFGYSTFYKIPDGLIDWEKITDMNSMFRECSQLKDLGDIDTSNITNMEYCFYNCSSLSDFKNIDISNATSLNNTFYNTKINDETIAKLNTSNVTKMSGAFANCSTIKIFPSIDTSKVTTFRSIFENSMDLEEVHPIDTSKATDLSNMFYNFSSEHKLRKLPEFDCTNVTNIGNMFSYYQDRMNYFTDCGGWKNLKINWNDNYGLRACANLTYQSCINILNGLWDFRGNGDTTTTRTLKVHQNFLTTVGDEVSIGTVKGWNITV